MRLSSTLGCFPELNMVMQEEAGQPISKISRTSNLVIHQILVPYISCLTFIMYDRFLLYLVNILFISFPQNELRHRNNFFCIFVLSFSFVYIYILKLWMHNYMLTLFCRTIHPRLLSAASCQENRVYRAAATVSLFGVKTRSHPSSRVSGYRSVLRYLTARLCVVSSFEGNTSALPWFKTGRRSLRAEVSRIELSEDARGCNKQLPVVYHIYPPRVQRANF